MRSWPSALLCSKTNYWLATGHLWRLHREDRHADVFRHSKVHKVSKWKIKCWGGKSRAETLADCWKDPDLSMIRLYLLSPVSFNVGVKNSCKMGSQSRLLHQMPACYIIPDKSRLNPTSAHFYCFHISSMLSDSVKIMKSQENSEICKKK